ncbi:hypothetical protein [Romboutsia hominis]|uniref:Uncharacterized protein n=1 Tax=Romboutsia hominis TaxID=1507512 RepID=A0A2P2BS31_9FIRM|nr:hypothetical protein [Romboutsia hominis]CEI73160.1 Hypothetical protein FRIFI_1627 [Romboutsia hominis]
MFRVNSKNRKKSPKEKTIKAPKYEEDLNEVILNDFLTEERKNNDELEKDVKSKKSNKLKVNLGLGSKKSKPKNSKKHQEEKDLAQIEEKNSKQVEEKSKNSNNPSKKSKNQKSNKSATKKPSKNNKIKPKEEVSHKKVKSKKSSNQKGKKVKPLSDESNIYVDENQLSNEINSDGYYEIEADDSVGFRTIQEEPSNEDNVVESEESSNKFENIVWSEEKFPKK